ncbi:MFS transporter [Actinospica robiniae]|uniref:MFS transporter n=1 Tax=Actinospica robiniae TaxID=304901 RepID=UPI00068443DF|nr:MFS transporter [Actinospica robiniae]
MTSTQAGNGDERAGAAPGVVLVVMCVGYFLVLLDVTIVNVALPSIGTGLHADVSSLQWVVDGYALALASLMLPAGALGDRHGHRRLVLAGLAAFGVGSLACGLAPGAGALVAARAVQGVGAASLLPGTLAIIAGAYPDRKAQARAIGIWAGVGSLALPAGPLVGGVLIDSLGWRWIFLINVPITLAALAATLRVLRADHGRQTGRLDTAGALLGVLVLLTWTFVFIQGGRSGAGSAVVLVALGLAILLSAAFLLVERRRGSEAMLPLDLARRPAFALANISAGVMNLGTLGVLFVLTLFLQSVQHRSPLGAGLALIPLFAPLAVIAPIGGRAVARIGPRLPIIAGFVLAAVGLALLALAHPSSSYAAILLPAFLAWGIGLGILTPAVVAAAVAATPGERAGLASAVNNTARQAGGAIGVALAGAVAGSPGTATFVSRMHTVAAGAAVLFVVLAVVNSLMKYQDSSTNSAEP